MRSRFILLVVAILLVAGFAALNWPEVTRVSPLLFGPVVMDAPLGLILLGLLAAAVIVFALTAGALRTHSLMESRHHYKELEAQRLLADKAEASRFTELRAWLDENLRQVRERDAIATTEMQRELRAQSETTNRMLAARLNELEHRLESRFERMGLGRGPAVAPVRSEPVVPPAVLPREHAMAEEARAAQLREEERLRDERLRTDNIREERDLRREERPADRPPESGWRKWF